MKSGAEPSALPTHTGTSRQGSPVFQAVDPADLLPRPPPVTRPAPRRISPSVGWRRRCLRCSTCWLPRLVARQARAAYPRQLPPRGRPPSLAPRPRTPGRLDAALGATVPGSSLVVERGAAATGSDATVPRSAADDAVRETEIDPEQTSEIPPRPTSLRQWHDP